MAEGEALGRNEEGERNANNEPAWKSNSNTNTPKNCMNGTWTTTTTEAAMPRSGMATAVQLR